MGNSNFFISYRHKPDFSYLDMLRQKFKQIGFSENDFKDYGFKNESLARFSKEFISNKIKKRIWASSITLVLVGERTAKSTWVNWEIWYSLRHLKRRDYPNIRSNPKGLVALFLPVQHHSVPKRLQQNLDSGYALRLDWHEFDDKFDAVIAQAQTIRNEKHRIKNRMTPSLFWHCILTNTPF